LQSKNDGEISPTAEGGEVDPLILFEAKKMVRSHPQPIAERWIRLFYLRQKNGEISPTAEGGEVDPPENVAWLHFTGG